MNDDELLRAYVDQRDESAFAELVRRHQDMVHSACLRRLGDAALAQDAAQTTFLLLAQRANRLQSHRSLGGWLYQTALFQSANLMRREQHRDRLHVRMQTDPSVDRPADASTADVGDEIRPHLDEALLTLPEDDREAVVLRFFGNQSLRDVGAALGTTEEAARKRVSRALERLGDWFKRRGVSAASIAALAAVMNETTEAAPVDLFPKITAGVHGAALVSDATIGAVFWAKVKLVTLVTAIAAVPIAWQLHVRHRLERELALRERPQPISVRTAAADAAWEPKVERPGALSLTLPEPPNQLMSMLSGVWALESRRGTEAKLALLREKLGLDATQVAMAASALLQAQLDRAELVQSLSQGEVQFEKIQRFLRAESVAMTAISERLSDPQRAELVAFEKQEAQEKAESVAKWRLSDLKGQLNLSTTQRDQLYATMIEHSLAYDSENVREMKSIDELLAWLNARQEDEHRRVRAILNDGQYRAYLEEPASGRSAIDLLRGGEQAP